MASSNDKSTGESVAACDYCNDRFAVLYCRADSAKLCLLCDHHVHSANALSHKHVRSQTCDNCSSEPASVRCSTDDLVLCQDCDWDAHGTCSASVSHDRTPVDGFSGCPSALNLASSWGLDLHQKKKNVLLHPLSPASPSRSSHDNHPIIIPNWTCQQEPATPICSSMYGSVATVQDLMVPNENVVSYSNIDVGEMKRRIRPPSCGKQKQVILKQLLELLNRGSVGCGGEDGCGGDLVPGTPNRSFWQGDEVTEPVLGSPNHVDPKESPEVIKETDMSWDNGSNYQPPTTQVSFPF